jgi:dTDP-4-dehydrorhamnose reductase
MSITFPQPVILVGFDGMLGTAWRAVLDEMGVEYKCPTLAEFNLTDEASIARTVTDEVQLVINCAAYTAVDKAEEQEELATVINGDGVGKLAARCKAVGAKLVHYSTDYVFPGNATSPYQPDAQRDPCNAYGRSKAVGEELIEQSGCNHLILRTSWLYAPWANNFVITIAKLAASRDELQVVNDQFGRPTSAQHLAQASADMIMAGASGTHHVTDGGQCSWYDFATEIVRLSGENCTVKPCDSSQFPRPAVRPAYSVLDLTSTEKHIGPMPHWKENLAAVMQQLRKKETISS